MSKEHVAKAMDKIVADPAFRKRVESAPKEALAEEGLELTEDELERLAGGIGFTITPTFAPPYVPVGPVISGDPLLSPELLPKK